MEEFLDFIKEPRFIHRTCLSLHWWPIGWQIFSRNGIYFSARYSCLCCVLWILFGDKGKYRQKILVFLKWKKKTKKWKGRHFHFLKERVEEAGFQWLEFITDCRSGCEVNKIRMRSRLETLRIKFCIWKVVLLVHSFGWLDYLAIL